MYVCVQHQFISVCHMNKKLNQTAGQVAHKSYQSCVVRATDIVMEANNNSHKFNLSTGQVTKNVASPPQNEPVIGLEDRLLLTRWFIYCTLSYTRFVIRLNYAQFDRVSSKLCIYVTNNLKLYRE